MEIEEVREVMLEGRKARRVMKGTDGMGWDGMRLDGQDEKWMDGLKWDVMVRTREKSKKLDNIEEAGLTLALCFAGETGN